MIQRVALLLSAWLVGCVGEGSDIGPDIPPLEVASFRLLLKDDRGRGVSSATVALGSFADAPGTSARSGRVDLFLSAVGRVFVQVDAEHASATSDDRLAAVRFAADVAGGQLPFVAHVADLSGSVGFDAAVGSLPSPVKLDDSAWSGAVLEFAAGTQIVGDGGPRVLVSTGSLRSDHLPPLRLPTGEPALVSRGIVVDPPVAGFAPGGSLSIPNDLGLPPQGAAMLFRLEPADGEWRSVGMGTVDGSGSRLELGPGAVPGGGIYAFAVPAPNAATVVGVATERPTSTGATRVLAGLRVRAGQSIAVTDGAGQFVLSGVPVTDAAGNVRPAVVTFAGGRNHRAAIDERELPPSGGGTPIDLGTVALDIFATTDIRLMILDLGRVTANLRVGVGSRIRATGGVAVADGNGRLDLRDVGDRYLGFLETSRDPNEVASVRTLEGLFFVDAQRSVDSRLFVAKAPWNEGDAGSAATWVVDSRTHAPLAGAYVFRTQNGVDERVRIIREDQIERDDLRGDEVVATFESQIDGRTTFGAFTSQRIFDGRIEMPIERARMTPPGAFDVFGRVHGTAPGPGPYRNVRVTGIVNGEVWLQSALAGESLAAAAPVFVEPARDGGTEFDVGVPSRGGTVVGLSGTGTAGSVTLDSVAFVENVAVAPGDPQPLDLGAAMAVDTDFVAPGLLAGRDAMIPFEEFRTDVAVELGSGRAVDVARGLVGNSSSQGDDLRLRLPALAGSLAGARHLVVWRGEAATAQVVRSQAAILFLDGSARPSRPLMEVPTVDAPAPGAQVPIGGFDVQFRLPADALYGVVHLRYEDGDVVRDWSTLVPPDSTKARFRTLPEGPQILAPGRYVLEVRAARASGSVAEGFPSPYGAVIARFVGLSAYDLDVESISAVRFEVELID